MWIQKVNNKVQVMNTHITKNPTDSQLSETEWIGYLTAESLPKTTYTIYKYP